MRRRRSSSASSVISTWKGRIAVAVSTVLLMTDSLAKRPERGADLGREEIRLLPGCKVITPVDLVEIDEVRIRLLGPAPRRLVELPRKDTHGGRHGCALDVEE